jgi:hypothetical protein
MTPALANLKPELAWKHFDQWAAIPRAGTRDRELTTINSMSTFYMGAS